jgi:hypothetical protein
MIYHLLPENEPFSAFSGVAISRNVSNMMRLDPSRVVVCPKSDDSWGFGADRIMVVPAVHLLARIRGRRFKPVLPVGIPAANIKLETWGHRLVSQPTVLLRCIGSRDP